MPAACVVARASREKGHSRQKALEKAEVRTEDVPAPVVAEA